MTPENFFSQPPSSNHKKYEVLRARFVDKNPISKIANDFEYKVNSVYSIINNFRSSLKKGSFSDQFFVQNKPGPKPKNKSDHTPTMIISLRKKNLSVSEIKSFLDAQDLKVSEKYITNLLREDGFARLPRRSNFIKQESLSEVKIEAPKSILLPEQEQSAGVSTQDAGMLCFLPYIRSLGLDKIIKRSNYPGTKSIPTLQSILCFLALKLSNVNRYTRDDLWCMDRGTGLFAGLTVLPKASWFTSYSHRVTREMNVSFLKAMQKLWQEKGLLSDSANLDFVSVPYWGKNQHLENNWSGIRGKALPSLLTALVQDPESGIITYGDTDIKKDNKDDTVIEFLDFYKSSGKEDLKYLIFDSKFTTYKNLKKLDDNGVMFLTIRRRGKKIVDELEALSTKEWKKVRVPTGDNKTRELKAYDQKLSLKGYDSEIRQVAITGHGKIKPALIITNAFDLSIESIVRKYARRSLIEKSISEQTHFFHLNRVSSSMVIKVDFDLTMTILAYNLYKLLALDLPRYEHNTASTLYDKFVKNGGDIFIEDDIRICLKKKRNLPALLTSMQKFKGMKFPWLGNRKLTFSSTSYS